MTCAGTLVLIFALRRMNFSESSKLCYDVSLKFFNKFTAFTRAYVMGSSVILMFAIMVGFMTSLMYVLKARKPFWPLVPMPLVLCVLPFLFVSTPVLIDKNFDLFLDAVAGRVPFVHIRSRTMAVAMEVRCRESSDQATPSTTSVQLPDEAFSRQFDHGFVFLNSFVPLFTGCFYTGKGQFYHGFWIGQIVSMICFLCVSYSTFLWKSWKTFSRGLQWKRRFDQMKNAIRIGMEVDQYKMMIGSMGSLCPFMVLIVIRGMFFIGLFEKDSGYSKGIVTISLVTFGVLGFLYAAAIGYHEHVQRPSTQVFLAFQQQATQVIETNEEDQEDEGTQELEQRLLGRYRDDTAHSICWFSWFVRRLECWHWLVFAVTLAWFISAFLMWEFLDNDRFCLYSLVGGLAVVVVYARQLRNVVGMTFHFSLFMCTLVFAAFFFLDFGPFQDVPIVSATSVEDIMNQTDWNALLTEGASTSRYPICSVFLDAWNRLSAVHLGVLSWYAYAIAHPEDFTQAKTLVERSFSHMNPEVVNTTQYKNCSKAGSLGILQVNFNGTTVVAIRGTANVDDLNMDTAAFTTVQLLQTANNIMVPILKLVPFSFLQYLLWIIKPQIVTEKIENVVGCVQEIMHSEPGQKKVLTGHSLGGLYAVIAGVQLGVETLVFSAPGVQLMQQAFGIADPSVMNRYSVLVPQTDPVPQVDIHLGNVHNIGCKATTPPYFIMDRKLNVACHSITRTLCELQRSCGNSSFEYSACSFADRYEQSTGDAR
mmetsp:Transcript_122201/g.211284  ORF Transcript_122201/g.211284 Transcript_122201/m.211284 type:complete len:761 (+) Transcript_122201:2-2284(+)